MSILICLLALTLGTPAARGLSFAEVHDHGLTGIDYEKDPARIRREAALYAFYRRYPNGPRGQELWQNCYENQETYFFCDMILADRSKAAETGTEKEKRKKFFEALISLDGLEARQKNCAAATKTLSSLTSDPATASLHARALYWRWVCAKTFADQIEARRLADALTQRFPLAYHTLLVLREDDPQRLSGWLTKEVDGNVDFRSHTVPEINPYIAGIEAAMESKEDGAAAVLGLYINAKVAAAEPGVRLYMASLMSRVSASVPSVHPVGRVLTAFFQNQPERIAAPLLRLIFPAGYSLPSADGKRTYIFHELISVHRGDLDGDLLAGLMHQESALNPRAASAAGAYGLTQMLIGTASDQWRLLSGDPQATVTPAMLQDPTFAVHVGAADLRRRLNNFSGNRVLAIASYNAGETGVKNWLKEIKPLKDQQLLADVLFMNRMNAEPHVSQYVSAVLGKALWYSLLYPPEVAAP